MEAKMNRCFKQSAGTRLPVLSGCLFACCAIVWAAAETDKTDPATGYCTLETRIIGKQQSAEQSASQYLESLEDRPSEIKDLPMGAGKDIRYFSLRIGTEDRFIMVDARTDLKSPYVLFADTNGDLRFSDEKAHLGKSIPEGWFGTDRFRFGPVTLTRQEGSQKIDVSFHVSTTEGDNLSIYPFQYLRGELSLAGAAYAVSVIDGNLDGRYDISPFTNQTRPAGLDSISFVCKDGSPDTQRYSGLLPLTKTVRLGDNYFDIQLDTAGKDIKLTPAKMDYGTLAVNGTDVRLRLWSNIAGQTLFGSESWKLPAGQYRILSLETFQRDNKGVWNLTASSYPSSMSSFVIGPDKTTTLQVGGAIRIRTSATRPRTGGDYLISYQYIGQGGELYGPSLYRNGQRQPAPGIRILDEKGKVLATDRLKYG